MSTANSGILKTQPTNFNTLYGQNFVFDIHRLRELNYFCTSVVLPGISFINVDVPTMFKTMPEPGDLLVFEPITITFIVDENLLNYRTIFEWMVGLTFPNNFSQYETLKNTSLGNNVKSDCVLHILDNKKQENIQAYFTDAFPISLSPLQFDIKQTDREPITADVSFAYQEYKFLYKEVEV